MAKDHDGESRVEINCNNLSQESILIVQSTNKDEYIIELILIIDALKRLGANQFLLDLWVLQHLQSLYFMLCFLQALQTQLQKCIISAGGSWPQPEFDLYSDDKKLNFVFSDNTQIKGSGKNLLQLLLDFTNLNISAFAKDGEFKMLTLSKNTPILDIYTYEKNSATRPQESLDCILSSTPCKSLGDLSADITIIFINLPLCFV